MCIITNSPKQSIPISKFIQEISDSFHENNDAEYLLQRLSEISQGFKKEPNPVTREEFENRAILFMIIKDLENFLVIKRNFIIASP